VSTNTPNPSVPQTVSISGSARGASTVTAILTVAPRCISKIILNDFRAFPHTAAPYEFDLEEGKNLLLFGENGSGKSSLFSALKLLLSRSAPPKQFEEFRNIFQQKDEGTITVAMTSGAPQDFGWNFGDDHPSIAGGPSFQELALRANFLDYKALLKTSFIHEEEAHVNVFNLLVGTLLKDFPLADNRTVATHWTEVKQVPTHPLEDSYESHEEFIKETKDWDAAGVVNKRAKEFQDLLQQGLTDPRHGILALINEFLAKLTAVPMLDGNGELIENNTLQIGLVVNGLKVKTVGNLGEQHVFEKPDIALTATYAGKPIPHPAIFLNEARLTAIALAIYLAAAYRTMPPKSASNISPLLVLDDALIGLDLAHRMPLLDILKGSHFNGWQIFLFTYDMPWFEMAEFHLPKDRWVSKRLFARVHKDGWEIPVLESDSPYLARAWVNLQDGDYKAAAVYLRSAWETVMREFCETKQKKVPLKREMREYKAEDFWPLVRKHEFKKDHLLVETTLAESIDLCRRYVLNPLCHSDPSRPNREEVRRAFSAVTRLKALLDQDINWRNLLEGKLSSAVKDLTGIHEKNREKALKGLTPCSDLALAYAITLLEGVTPPLLEISCLLRSALDHGLLIYCQKKNFDFTIKSDQPITTEMLWTQATTGAAGLRATQPVFVTGIESHSNLLLAESPDRTVMESKTLVDMKAVADLLRGTSAKDNPKCVLRDW
jgi:energy-coupling factor transporter ATP-binding protein EcfA2